MPTLNAKFTFELDSPCLATWAEDSAPQFNVSCDGFDVAVRLVRDASSARRQEQGSTEWKSVIGAFEIKVSREEPDEAPATVVGAGGSRDMTGQQAYLQTKMGEYATVSRKIADRILSFFKFELSTPLVRPFGPNSIRVEWFDWQFNELVGPQVLHVEAPAGFHGHLNATSLTTQELPALARYVLEQSEATLAQSLLSDAQSAWFQGNFRRAVLELAVCVEVLVKRKFFAAASPAGAAFDYLEDKAKITVRILELLGPIALEAFGRSYKADEPQRFQSIDRLLRCRNKIAHRGELRFRDDAGTWIEAESAQVEEWWLAAAHLMRWLNQVG